MTSWQWASADHTSVQRTTDDGWESRSVADPEIAGWIADGGTPDPEESAPVLTQREVDLIRFDLRAKAKDRLIAEMAADNMERVRSGVWSVSDLTELMGDATVNYTLDLIATLSFELAADSLADVTHPLITPEIKAKWIQLLQSHFYI